MGGFRVSMVSGAGQALVGTRIIPVSVEVFTGQLAVPVAPAPPVAVLAPAINTTYVVVVQNTSPGVQLVRVGLAPSFVAGALSGMLVNPANAFVFDFFAGTLFALANAALATIDVAIWST